VHVLTKTLVVLAAVLSVALSALVIAYAVNTDRIAADYGNALRRETAANAMVSANLAAYNTTETQLNATIAALNNQILQAKKTSDDLAAENATLRTAAAKAESERQSVVNKIAELGETTKTQAEIIKNYREENSSLRNSDLSLRTRQAELDDRINDLESQREVLEQNYRALQEQIAEAKRAQEQLLTGNRQGTASMAAVAPDIKGRVEAVQYDDVLKKTIVKINIGANDRVGKNMAFYITRGSTFVGRVQVNHDPDLKFSVGELVLLSPGQEVRVGDQVSTHL
jgi:predicted  nucleic acid-binding Zn-ribbon protein